MADEIDARSSPIQAVRWVARAWAVVSIGLVVAFLVGEGFHPSRIQASEWLGLAFFPVGICAGMILAWWKEGFGGAITVGSLAAFYVIHFATVGTFPRGWAFLAFAAPGFLFVALARHQSNGRRGARGRTLIAMGGAFLLLSTAFPVVASVMTSPAARWLGIADVVVAVALVSLAFVVAAKGTAKPGARVMDVSFRVVRGGAVLFLALIVVFFLAGQRVKWEILLVGLAWRAWLFVWILPAAVALWHDGGPPSLTDL